MAKNLVQMSINGILYDIRDQRMAVKLDSLGSSLNLALEHKQDTTTAVVTNEASVNWIGRLTSGSTNLVIRNTDDYVSTITGTHDTHVHSLWFSTGPISYGQTDKENKELEQLRAWSKSFGLEFQDLTKKPRILGLDTNDQKTEVDIYGRSLHTEYIDSPLGVSYINPNKVKNINHDITGLPQSIQEIDRTQWLYYGDRENETQTVPTLEANNVIGLESAITNIALYDFFQKENDNNYYRVLSEERIANKQIDKSQRTANAYKIVTLDETGVIPDIFLGEMKLDKQLSVGNTTMVVENNHFILANDSGDDFVLEIQPSATDDNTTKLTQDTITTKDIFANNATMSNKTETKTLEVTSDTDIGGNTTIGGYVKIDGYAEIGGYAKIDGNAEIGGEASIGEQLVIGDGLLNTSGSTDSNVSINKTKVRASNILATKCLTIPVFSNEANALAAANAAPSGTAAIWIARY